ncbi:MAG TPA: choice-of-anchor D domain-containing protein [Thermoanaerobaculia bacterium]|nr:choice-of-anchor D domain-containing protein [Thermoanaerobaculia bacterium]
MSRLDVSIRGLRLEERSRRSQARQRLLEAFAVLLLAALATGYSRERMTPAAVLSMITDFGRQQVGLQSAAQTLEIRNNGRSELRIDKVGISGEGAAEFFLPEEECSRAALAAGKTCTIAVAFLPHDAGASQAALTIEDNSPRSPHVVVLGGTGFGVMPPPPAGHADPAIEPAEAALTADVDAKAVQDVTVHNNGDAPLALVEVSFSGDAGDFAVDSSACAGGPLAPAGSCTLRITFAPRRAGPQTATLIVKHDAPVGPLLVALQGQGIGPPEGFCCVGGEVLTLDAVACRERQGEFALDEATFAGRCKPLDPDPPPPPLRLWPGYEDAPQTLDECSTIVLHWTPVKDPSEPIDYLVTLENGRGKAGTERPTDWGEIARETVQAAEQLDVSGPIGSILHPKPTDPRAVVAPPLNTRELLKRLRAEAARAARDRNAGERGGRDRGAGDRGEAETSVPAVISFPVFRWRVSARDAAGNEGSASEWRYFSCKPEQTVLY